MLRQESFRDWVDDETRHIDVVASWDNLYYTYDTMRFTDQLSDEERLGEFRWIVQQMNVFLTKMRSKLMSCKDLNAALKMLKNNFTPSGKMELKTRKALVYQKLKQQWVSNAIMQIQAMMNEEEQDGWTGSGDDGYSGGTDSY